MMESDTKRMSIQFDPILECIREIYSAQEEIHLHQPSFGEEEKAALLHCLESTHVAGTGSYVQKFEDSISQYTASPFAVAVVNGTTALHLLLKALNIGEGDIVLTQALSFVATRNAIIHAGAEPVFVDIDKETLGISPEKLNLWLRSNTIQGNGQCVHKDSKRRIAACIPVHTFGLPCSMDEIAGICNDFGITLLEDAAEALGSFSGQRHCGTIGKAGVLSFNGNKTITSGGGGMILTGDESLASKLKHLSTQAKVPHAWAYLHDETGYNYRLPNLNAALGYAQMLSLEDKLESKTKVHKLYSNFFKNRYEDFIVPKTNDKWNHWLNAVLFSDMEERDAFLSYAHQQKIYVRPAWHPLDKPSGRSSEEMDNSDLSNTYSIYRRLVNLPSSPR